jgi:Ca2+-binding EF-hand superfamily protein
MHTHSPTHSRLFEALDTNHDGVIDATEIANAPAALKALDANGDGVITPDELQGSSERGE